MKKYIIPLILLTMLVSPALADVQYVENATSIDDQLDGSNPTNAYDGDWDTYAITPVTSPSGTEYLYLNYTKPDYSENATWEIKYGRTQPPNPTSPVLSNTSIDQTCFDYDSTLLLLRFRDVYGEFTAEGSYYWECYNGTWVNVYNSGGQYGTYFYEEGVYFEVGEAPPVEEVGYMQTLLSDVGAGTGAFIEAITEPVYDLSLMLAIAVGTLGIVYAFSSIVNTALRRS